MKSAANKPTHVTRGNVMDDLGFAPENATALKFKAELYRAILKCARKYSKKDLQGMLGEPQNPLQVFLRILSRAFQDGSIQLRFELQCRCVLRRKAKIIHDVSARNVRRLIRCAF